MFDFNEIQRRAAADPRAFIAEADVYFRKRVRKAAAYILEGGSPIVLLAGPSGSGKTTTAAMVQRELRNRGITSHVISMDDYFLTVNPETHPRGKKGEIDFESPHCLDIKLFLRHTAALSAGQEVFIPRFDFRTQRQELEGGFPLRLEKDDIAIFEGIHALNPLFFGPTPCCKIYISASSDIGRDGALFFKSTWIRLIRRLIRDQNFRGMGAKETMALWGSIRRGEKQYISPYKQHANVRIDTVFPYELCVLRELALPLLADLPDMCERRAELASILPCYEAFIGLSPSLIAPDSLLREFVGGLLLVP